MKKIFQILLISFSITIVIYFIQSFLTFDSISLLTNNSKEKPNLEFGFNLNDFNIERDTIKSGDSFGEILASRNVSYPKIYKIVENIKDSFDVRWLTVGKAYAILYSKDSLNSPKYFIYQPNLLNYVVVDFANYDSIIAYNKTKPFKIVDRQTSGVISNSLSETMDQNGLPWELINKLSDIYAWTIDFTRIKKGDKFKIVYKERYIEDSILVGIKSIDAAYFEHEDQSLYAFNFLVDSSKNVTEFFDENGKSLQRTFLKSPLRFSNISSRYNLKRRIAYYGNKVRPHRGTDFAAPTGTPIMATASGKVVKSSYTRGNGYYVKIKHNKTYSTQYLHMQKRGRVKQGSYVKQGDIIGKIGMTGNTSGPHVCYRFWKNGKQVDPFKQKLPPGKPIPKNLNSKFTQYLTPLKTRLDNINYD